MITNNIFHLTIFFAQIYVGLKQLYVIFKFVLSTGFYTKISKYM